MSWWEFGGVGGSSDSAKTACSSPSWVVHRCNQESTRVGDCTGGNRKSTRSNLGSKKDRQRSFEENRCQAREL